MRFVPSYGRDFQLTLDAQRARGYEMEKLSGGLIDAGAQDGPADRAGYDSRHHRQRRYHRRYGPARLWHRPAHLAGCSCIYRRRDRILIGLAALMLLASIGMAIFGIGRFWIPAALLV